MVHLTSNNIIMLKRFSQSLSGSRYQPFNKGVYSLFDCARLEGDRLLKWSFIPTFSSQ